MTVDATQHLGDVERFSQRAHREFHGLPRVLQFLLYGVELAAGVNLWVDRGGGRVLRDPLETSNDPDFSTSRAAQELGQSPAIEFSRHPGDPM